MASPQSPDPAPAVRPAPPVTVRKYHPPSGLDWVVIAGMTAYIASFALVHLCGLGSSSPSPGSPSSFAAALLLQAARFFPGGAPGFRRLVDAIAVPVLAIHVAEAWWMDRSRLAAHGVARGSAVWWAWVGGCLVEGVTAFRRFDRVVAALEEERGRGRGRAGKGKGGERRGS